MTAKWTQKYWFTHHFLALAVVTQRALEVVALPGTSKKYR